MIRDPMIFDDPFFRRLWDSDIQIPQIAKVYGTSRAAIYRASYRFGMQRRGVVAVVHPPNPPADLHGALLWSQGHYSRLNRVADEHDLTMRQVQIQYHKARANVR